MLSESAMNGQIQYVTQDDVLRLSAGKGGRARDYTLRNGFAKCLGQEYFKHYTASFFKASIVSLFPPCLENVGIKEYII